MRGSGYGWEFSRKNDFTYEGFFYRTSLTSDPTLFFGQSPASNWAVSLKLVSGKLTARNVGYGGAAASLALADTTDFPLNQWVYVCFERKGDVLRIYRAGEADTNATMVAKETLFGLLRQTSTFDVVGLSASGYGNGWFAGSGSKVDGVRLTMKAR